MGARVFNESAKYTSLFDAARRRKNQQFQEDYSVRKGFDSVGIGWGGGGLAKSGVLKQFWVYLRPDEAGRNGK